MFIDNLEGWRPPSPRPPPSRAWGPLAGADQAGGVRTVFRTPPDAGHFVARPEPARPPVKDRQDSRSGLVSPTKEPGSGTGKCLSRNGMVHDRRIPQACSPEG
jgi:hypothetical protein